MILMTCALLLGSLGDGPAAPSGQDLNSHAWLIITVMGGVIATLGGVIVKLYKDLQRCEGRNRKFIEDQLALIRTLRNEFDKPYP